MFYYLITNIKIRYQILNIDYLSICISGNCCLQGLVHCI